jgi:hypothetical protein
MLILKKDLPFAKKGSEAHRKYKKDVTSDDYDWYVRDDNRILHWIGDSTMDMSDWIEEVPDNASLEVTTEEELINKVRETMKEVRRSAEGTALFQRTRPYHEIVSKELNDYTAKIVEVFEKRDRTLEKELQIMTEAIGRLHCKIEKLKCYKKDKRSTLAKEILSNKTEDLKC